MDVCDMHCDTLTGFVSKKEKDPTYSFASNDMDIDLDKLKRGGYLLQNFAIFTFLKAVKDPVAFVRKHIDAFYELMNTYSDVIQPVTKVSEIYDNRDAGLISAMLTIEEGAVIDHDLSILKEYYDKGARMVALSWNFENGLTHPNFHFESGENGFHTYDDVHGLTEEGFAYIKEMERLGMIIDVSHMSDACFYDVYEHTTKPFVASHSNARAVCDHARNMSDDMILKLAKRGGVMGMNMSSHFLNGTEHADVHDIVRHINYIRDLAGIDVIGLGTDFDGIESGGLNNASEMPLLKEALKQEGYSKEEIDKIFYKNVLRVYEEVL